MTTATLTRQETKTYRLIRQPGRNWRQPVERSHNLCNRYAIGTVITIMGMESKPISQKEIARLLALNLPRLMPELALATVWWVIKALVKAGYVEEVIQYLN